MVPAIALLLLTIHTPKVPYILEYSCDSGWGDDLQYEVCPETRQPSEVSTATFYLPDTAKRSFPTRQQVIDWLEENYAYWPVKLMHGQTELTCQVKYLDSDSLDIWRAHQKEVDCDTRENLEKRHGKEEVREWE